MVSTGDLSEHRLQVESRLLKQAKKITANDAEYALAA